MSQLRDVRKGLQISYKNPKDIINSIYDIIFPYTVAGAVYTGDNMGTTLEDVLDQIQGQIGDIMTNQDILDLFDNYLVGSTEISTAVPMLGTEVSALFTAYN